MNVLRPCSRFLFYSENEISWNLIPKKVHNFCRNILLVLRGNGITYNHPLLLSQKGKAQATPYKMADLMKMISYSFK